MQCGMETNGKQEKRVNQESLRTRGVNVRRGGGGDGTRCGGREEGLRGGDKDEDDTRMAHEGNGNGQ